MRRIARLIRMFLSLFVDGLEDSVPLDRRLAQDRAERAGKVRQMMDKATDIGAAATMMVEELATAQIQATNLRQEATSHLQAAQAAASRGDSATAERENAQAAALTDDIANAEDDIAELKETVRQSLADKEEAKQMVLDQAAELARLARNDTRLVARMHMSEMRQQTLALKESLMGLVPGDDSDMRQRAQQRIKQQEAKVSARRDLVNALWKQKQRGTAGPAAQVSARGAEILRELQQQVGYQPAREATPAEEERQASRAAGA